MAKADEPIVHLRPFDGDSPSTVVWATYTKGRYPNFKIHRTRGIANQAVGAHYPAYSVQVLHLHEGQWWVVEDWVRPDKCSNCGKPGCPNRRPWGYQGTMYKAPLICVECYEKDRKVSLTREREEQEREAYNRLKEKYGD